MGFWLIKAMHPIDWDSYEDAVIKAANERSARKTAHAHLRGDETRWHPNFWLDTTCSSCVELKAADYTNGEIILEAFHAG